MLDGESVGKQLYRPWSSEPAESAATTHTGETDMQTSFELAVRVFVPSLKKRGQGQSCPKHIFSE